MLKSGHFMFAVGATVVVAVSTSVRAAPIIEGPGSFTYTYHAGSDTPDPNADTGVSPTDTSYIIESPSAGNAAYYHTTVSSGTGTLSYTFTATAGHVFLGNATSLENSLIAFNPNGEIQESVSLDGGAPTTFYTWGTFGDSLFHFDYTTQTFSVNGASTFTITYTLTNPSGNAILTQVLREQNGDTGNPFVVTGTVSPEPASAGLLALGTLGVLARRRRD